MKNLQNDLRYLVPKVGANAQPCDHHQVPATEEVVDLPTGNHAMLQQLLAKEQADGYNLAEALRHRMQRYAQ